MAEPLNLREIERAATDALGYSKVRSTRSQASHVLVLVAPLREAREHAFRDGHGKKTARGWCHVSGWLCETCAWLAQVRDEEVCDD